MEITKVEDSWTEYQGWSAWADKFKPKPNHLSKYPNEMMYETYGEEVEYVQNHDPNFVWTLVTGDMSDLIVAGYAYVNRLGYYITEIPWEDDMDCVLISVEKECECYDEEDGGNPECTKCDGYGLITEYVG